MLFANGKNRGNIIIILLGLISVMLVMVMALSRRMSGHVQLLTLSDYTQISRYFLESYSGDVLRQINTQANKIDSKMFKAFRENATNKKFDTSFYKPSPMLASLANELKIEFGKRLEISFKRTTELSYPKGFYCPNYKGKEKRGSLEIVCNATFRKKRYTLRVQYPYKVVARMTPIIKDFVLFADRISEEQGKEKIGPDDHINVMCMKDGKYDEYANSRILSLCKQSPIVSSSKKYRPFLIMPPQDRNEFGNIQLSGKVFLGKSDDSVYLNLPGSTKETVYSSMGELFLIDPSIFSTFNVANKNTKLEHIGVFNDKSGAQVKMLGMNIPLKHNHIAKMGILGFAYESVPTLGAIFKGIAYSPTDFFGTAGEGGKFWKDILNYGTGYMGLSTGLKLMGQKPPELGGKPAAIPIREIYGNVLSRFFVLTFWWAPSKGGDPLKYSESRNSFPERDVYGIVKYHFEPMYHSQSYQDFMSRIVSGRPWEPKGNLPPGFIPYNSDFRATGGKIAKKIYTWADFNSNDGCQAKIPLDQLGRSWFKIHTSNSNKKSGIEERITKVFKSGDEFLKAAQVDGRFDVNGVVYVKGDLKMPSLDMPSDKIGGGVVLVGGRLTLGNITRGTKVDTDQLDRVKLETLYQKLKTEVKQDNFLTFVSLNGAPITIEGEALLGVQLINFCDPFKQSHVYDQIKWKDTSRKEILFCGGIACDYLNLPKRLEEFGRVRTPNNFLGAPFFMYQSAMAAPKPSFATQIMENMRGYKLTAKGVAK